MYVVGRGKPEVDGGKPEVEKAGFGHRLHEHGEIPI